MEQNLNDKTACLVTAFQSGDVSAFSTLYDMHINLLFNYGCKLTTDKELLKDCIHDVFVKLYTKKAELGIIDNFKSYLLISLKNKLCDERRRRIFMSETAVEELKPVAAGDDVEHKMCIRDRCKCGTTDQCGVYRSVAFCTILAGCDRRVGERNR